jgi:Uma2 family endonuclease
MTVQLEAKPLFDLDAFREFCDRPENADRSFELDHGRIVEMPRPSRLHGLVCGILAGLFDAYLRMNREGDFFTNDTGLMLDETKHLLLGPDLIVLAKTSPGEVGITAWLTEIPDLVVEVLSPSDRQNSVMLKVNQYLEYGVKMVWIVDPEEQSVGIHRPGQFQMVDEEAELVPGFDILPNWNHALRDFFTRPNGQPIPRS